MYLTTVAQEESEKLHSNKYRETALCRFIREFVESEENVMEVADWKTNYRDAYVASRTINVGAKRHHFSVHAFARKGRVFLCREDWEADVHA